MYQLRCHLMVGDEQQKTDWFNYYIVVLLCRQ
jgi:hypothetical protein